MKQLFSKIGDVAVVILAIVIIVPILVLISPIILVMILSDQCENVFAKLRRDPEVDLTIHELANVDISQTDSVDEYTAAFEAIV